MRYLRLYKRGEPGIYLCSSKLLPRVGRLSDNEMLVLRDLIIVYSRYVARVNIDGKSVNNAMKKYDKK